MSKEKTSLRKTLTISLPEDELAIIERYWREKHYDNRSSFIKEVVMDKIRSTRGYKKV